MEIEVQNIEIANGDPIVVSIPTITVDSTNENIELAVTRKEFNIIGDSVFIGSKLEDTPQWLLDYIDTLNDLALDDKINSINGLSQSLEDLIVAVDAAKNAYTSAVITYEELELMVNSKIDTLNSSLSGADSTIIEILNTKVTPTEAQTIATTALQASIDNGAIGALIGSVQEAIADESSARATEIDVLTAQLDGFDDTYSTALTGLETTVANNSGVISAHSTEFTKLNTAITSGNFDTYGASNFFNTLSSEIDGAVIKAGSNFAYDSTLVIGPYAYNSGFGIKSTGSSGSNVAVDGTNYPLWNSEFWVKADNFKIVAANQTAAAQNPFSVNAATGDILLNGMVRFTNTSGGTGTLQDVVQGYVETVQVGDKNINITDNLIPMTSMLTDIANAGYQFVVTPIKTSTAGISVYAEPQVQLDVDDEIYSPFVNELVVSYYYRFGIKGITALTNVKICTIDAVDAVTYGDISYTMDAGQTLVDTDWYIIDGLVNPAGGSTGVGGSIRKADGTKIGTVNAYVMPAGSTKLLLGWIGACTVSRCKLAKVNADTVTGDLASIDYVNTTQIDGGRIITGSILSDKIAANISITSPVISGGAVNGTVINGGTINGGTINGVNINGAVIKASWIDYSSTGTLTNWAYYTPATMPAQYSTNFAHDSSTGALITDSNGFVRLPKVSKVIIGSFLYNVGSTANVYTLGNVSFAGYDLDVHSFDDYTTTSTRRLLNANTRIVFDSASIPFLTVRGGAGYNNGSVGTCSATWRIGTDVFVYYGLSQAINQGADPHTYTTRLSKNGVYLMDVTATLPSGGSAAGVSYIADIVSCGIATRVYASGASISVVILNAINDTVAYIGANTTISVGACSGYSSDNMNVGIKVYVPTGTESY